MNKKQFFIVLMLCLSTFVASSMVKEEMLYMVSVAALSLFCLVFFLQKSWIEKTVSILLVAYSLFASFIFFMISIDWVLPDKKTELYQVQNFGGWSTVFVLVLSLAFSVFFAWEIRKNRNRKTILIYIGGIALCLLPSLLKHII